MNRSIVSGLISLALLSSMGVADAATVAYLHLKGQKQGDIKGSVVQRGHEGTSTVFGSTDTVISPRDAASGLPTGKRMHKPYVMLKELDKASMALRTALTNNENLPTVTLQYFNTAANGTEALAYTVTMTNASVASIEFHQPNARDAAEGVKPLYEEIAFVYQRITYTTADGNMTSSDVWE